MTTLNDAERLAALESELRAERQRVAQREQMLATLNRRLVVLEQGGGIDPTSGLPSNPEALRARVRELEIELSQTQGELERLRRTKLFTWSAPLRRVYGVFVRR